MLSYILLVMHIGELDGVFYLLDNGYYSGVVLYQVLQIKKQIQLQTLIDLGKEWDSEWIAECRPKVVPI